MNATIIANLLQRKDTKDVLRLTIPDDQSSEVMVLSILAMDVIELAKPSASTASISQARTQATTLLIPLPVPLPTSPPKLRKSTYTLSELIKQNIKYQMPKYMRK